MTRTAARLVTWAIVAALVGLCFGAGSRSGGVVE